MLDSIASRIPQQVRRVRVAAGVPVPVPAGPLPGGHPLIAVYGENGPQIAGWLRRYNPEVAAALHLFEAVLRSPYLLAQLLCIAGGVALTQVGRILVADPGELEG